MTALQQIDTQALNSRFDVRQLAGRYTTLHREAANELAGPCPRCGGTDRFHVSPSWWFCRSCHEKRSDAIGLMRFVHDCTFLEAVQMLDATTLPATKVIAPAPVKPGQTRPDAAWFATQPANMARYRDALWDGQNPGRSYLTDRGLTAETAIAWGLGYAANAMNRGPAIAIPWFRGKELFAIHFRFLDGQKPKLKYELGSRPAGLLCGRHAFRDGGRALFIIEGEFNAMSVWQLAHKAHVDVLSMGGQDTTITPAAIAFAQQYPVRIVWMDEEERAKKKASSLHGGAFWSVQTEHEGKTVKCDANELLQRWALAEVLERVLTSAGADAADMQRLGA
jgi:phage/plasmid primase-like uncharacterized protein